MIDDEIEYWKQKTEVYEKHPLESMIASKYREEIGAKTIKLIMRVYVFKEYINKACYGQPTDKEQMSFINEVFGDIRRELVDIASLAFGEENDEFVERILKIYMDNYKKKKFKENK